jgi:hypothetical protein
MLAIRPVAVKTPRWMRSGDSPIEIALKLLAEQAGGVHAVVINS